MDSTAFVASLVEEMSTLFSELGDAETLESEAEGRLEIPTLLRLALKSEVEAAEIAGLWLPTTAELDAKTTFAQQAHDEMKHYQLITARLHELGQEPGELEAGASPLYHYLTTLRTTVERVSAGPFAREAVAEVRNEQFILFCRSLGDERTASLYEDVIQPEEVQHNRLGRELLVKYAVTPHLQELARAAMRTSLAIADELRTLKERRTGLHIIPVS